MYTFNFCNLQIKQHSVLYLIQSKDIASISKSLHEISVLIANLKEIVYTFVMISYCKIYNYCDNFCQFLTLMSSIGIPCTISFTFVRDLIYCNKLQNMNLDVECFICLVFPTRSLVLYLGRTVSFVLYFLLFTSCGISRDTNWVFYSSYSCRCEK